ncbi:unnamed protein product [Phytophthora fragariaefolia]|uniref:Unnamed protein product n=1 Tax=Phytophthora fragariaefolia TaxID=1490495 RepID=A0A9W7CUP3_9STRA|nr:unnamed protein product [Phytophthora fragariaefolia]
MATQVHVFVSGMNAGYQRFYLTRKTPSTLEEAFTVALPEDYSVSASHAFDASRPLVHDPEPEPMEVDTIQSYRLRREPTSPSRQSSTRGSRPMMCFRCGKPGHRAAVCRAPSPMAANATTVNDVAASKHGDGHPPVLHARLSATTSGGDVRRIVLSLHVEDAQGPIRTLLDSGATNNFVRATSLPALPADMSIRVSGGEMIVKYANGKPRRTPRRSATFAYKFDGFRSSEAFLVIELSGSFDCVFGIPRLARHQPAIDWLAVMDPDSMTHAAPEESDDPSCARELPEDVDAAGQLPPRLGADVEFRHPESADVIEHGFSLSAGEDTPRPVRRRGRRKPRRPRAPSQDPVETESEVISVLVGNNADEPPRACNVEVARPPCDAAEITRLPGLSWKHFLRDLRRGEIEQVCMIVAEDAASIAAVETHASGSKSDARTRPKGAEPKTTRASRYAAQSLPALEAAGNPVAPLVREFSDTFPDKVPAALPPDRGVRHEIDLVPGANPTFCMKKATGGWRIVHAFNKRNDATIAAQTPIPRKAMVLDTMSGSTKFSAIDLMDGFYYILMREVDVPLTAVSTPSGMIWE